MSEAGPRFGGIGAVVFLAAFGGIAFFVQEQSTAEREIVRKPASLVEEVEEEAAPAALPWQDRVDLQAARMLEYGASASALPTVGGADPESGAGEGDPAPAETAAVDPANARYVQELGDGHKLLFTLDPVLHDSAQTIFRNREVPYAAAVMLDLKDNSVLAFAGHSTMDPQVDPLEVLNTAWAPAASTFKLVTTAALLDHHDKVTPSTRACFHGGLHGITDVALKDDPKLDTRCETLAEAVAHSYNLVIGKLALKHLEQAELVETARALGYDTDIPFEFPIERSPALIPTDANERAKVAAGFWNVDLSPVHAALLAGTFARGGVFQPPHLIAQVVAPDGSDVTPAAPPARRVLDAEVAQEVARMMLGTTMKGTAKSSFYDGNGQPFVPQAKVAGKTGSLTGKRPPMLNYNWFIGFAPAERPEIAFAVLLANEPKWRIKAHYAGRRLVQLWLTRREAIARARDARLNDGGVHLPERDPETGALIAKTPNPDKEQAQPAAPALPPVPGPVAKPDPEPAPANG
jgi:membrane peptidoglycan carboxypeptidase